MKLSEIPYQRPNAKMLGQRIQDLCTQFENAKNVALQLEVIHQINDLQLDFYTTSTLASIRYHLNSFDEFYEKENAFFRQEGPILRNFVNHYYRVLLNTPFRATLEQKLGKRLFQVAEFCLEQGNETTTEIDQKLNQLKGEYFKTISQGTVVFQGKKYPIRGLGRFAQSEDGKTREAAKDAVYDFWASKEKEFHSSFDEMVQLRDKRAQVLGFENYIKESYHHCDFNGEDVSNFSQNILKHFIPIKKRLHERKLKRLGVKELHYYDTVSYKNGNPKLQTEGAELWSNMQKMYAELSPETDEFCQFMLKNELLDTAIRKGKTPGAFATSIKKHGLPFILGNFTGIASDFHALTHEMGHAFQDYQTHKAGVHQVELSNPQSDVAEIHAIGMELFTWDWYPMFFKEDTAKFQFSKITKMLTSIVSNCCREDFQQFVYRNPKASSEERNQKWLELNQIYAPHHTKAIYGDNAYLKSGSQWQSNPHIMCMPFYAIEYSLANLCAVQFWMKAQNNKEETWNDYLQLCRIGGKYTYFESLQLANLRSPFEEEVIKEIAEFLSDWLEGVDDSGF